ncbi:hypothetical protein LDENG_00125440, partial [Lucifuga dentata]
ELQLKRAQITFLIDPFSAQSDCLKAPLVTDEAVSQIEMIELSEDIRLKSILKGTLVFWKTVPTEKYPYVKQASLKLLSTYVCDSVFNHETYQIKASICAHGHPLERTAFSCLNSFNPDFKAIMENKHCH